jgi:hypothetical protein
MKQAEQVEGADQEIASKIAIFIDADLSTLFTRVAEYVKKADMSIKLDCPDCSIAINEDGEFIFRLYYDEA